MAVLSGKRNDLFAGFHIAAREDAAVDPCILHTGHHFGKIAFKPSIFKVTVRIKQIHRM